MSKSREDKGLAGWLSDKEKRLFKLENFHWRGRHRYVNITNPVRVVNAVAQSSTVGFTDLPLSGNVGVDISADTIAVILAVYFKDSGSAGTATSAQFRVNGGAATANLLVSGHHINSQFNYGQGIVAIDSGYVLEYAINASGVGTAGLDVYLAGYIEQLK